VIPGVRLQGSHSPTDEHRKTVSALFCDVVGSTALGESVDPEALQALLARYFEQLQQIAPHHRRRGSRSCRSDG
jgi:class 3 adenylate cyclase